MVSTPLLDRDDWTLVKALTLNQCKQLLQVNNAQLMFTFSSFLSCTDMILSMWGSKNLLIPQSLLTSVQSWNQLVSLLRIHLYPFKQIFNVVKNKYHVCLHYNCLVCELYTPSKSYWLFYIRTLIIWNIMPHTWLTGSSNAFPPSIVYARNVFFTVLYYQMAHGLFWKYCLFVCLAVWYSCILFEMISSPDNLGYIRTILHIFYRIIIVLHGSVATISLH